MSERASGVGVGLTVPVAIVIASLLGSPLLALTAIAVALLIGWRNIDGFWRLVIRGVIAGALAGLLVLGPGLRLAMRVVAIVDPVEQPEFTFEGTVFIVLIIGGMLGGITVGWTTIINQTLSVPRWVGVSLISAVISLQLFADSEILSELTGLGAGLWMNLPMFTGVTILFAFVADRWARPSDNADLDHEGASIEAAVVQ